MLCAYNTLLSQKRIVLASTSARRKEILNGLGISFEVVESPFDEEKNRPAVNDPVEFTKWTASQKALAVVQKFLLSKDSQHAPDFVIGADTVVVHNEKIIGKPTSPSHAKNMLKGLSGSEHSVATGISIHYKCGTEYKEKLCAELTKVRMTVLTDNVIDKYVETGEPLDKAGSYGIQGLGGSLIESIDGCYFNVMGLPLHRFTIQMLSILKEMGEIEG